MIPPRRFIMYWYNFIVGDDWRLAIGVIVGLSLVSVARSQAYAIWLLPAMIMIALVWSVFRFAKANKTGR
jgi:hypothetical protein